ncbi:MAG: PfkB family carbohydrate kinase [Rhodoferax sp.]|uniref:carbohydrate kinase family protein n=1 Tax=Rhodoferax sp. TaxID=50421 RepID=UPI00260D9AD3|nr:PfkB family carbohydrate kinase [Rhodoferax sp.]MDD2882605.1 PfkB family carbohydrate kinase [Rhodoferax sp.]
MTDLVVIGLAYFEVFVPPHVRPPAGEEVFVDGIQLALGGALNTASVAAALGLKVTLCLPMGQGLVDQAVTLLAQRLGITLVPLAARDNPAISLVFSDAHDRAFVSTAELDVLSSVKHLPASTWVHVPGLEEAARLVLPLALARQNGANISVSGSWSPLQLSQLASRQDRAWDLLVLNEKEALAACGTVDAAPQRLAHTASSVLVTQGSQGIFGMLNGTPLRLPAVPTAVLDATGAGDAFCAGVITGLVRGALPKAAVQLGARTAGKILKQAGGLVTDSRLMADLTCDNLCKP